VPCHLSCNGAQSPIVAERREIPWPPIPEHAHVFATSWGRAVADCRAFPAAHCISQPSCVESALPERAISEESAHGSSRNRVACRMLYPNMLPQDELLLGPDLGAGLFVIGTFARSRLAELIHGSGTRDIVKHSTVTLCLQH
jgi:hypothetical protein